MVLGEIVSLTQEEKKSIFSSDFLATENNFVKIQKPFLLNVTCFFFFSNSAISLQTPTFLYFL